jgi:GntR family transcriptional regulator
LEARVQFQIATAGREPIYRQLATQIREGVARGRLKPGARLPSVRELSRTLVVNPNTIARAYTELERDGVLHTRQGLGVFVAEPTNDLTKTARRKKLADLIDGLDGLLTEAVYLGFSSSEVIAAVTERTARFEWQPAAAGGGKS